MSTTTRLNYDTKLSTTSAVPGFPKWKGAAPVTMFGDFVYIVLDEMFAHEVQ